MKHKAIYAHCLLGFSMSGLIRYVKEKIMANGRTPGTNTGKTGGIFQEVGPRGGRQPNFAAVPDNRPLPPTSKPNSTWAPVKTTPNSKR
ncbi:MAG: hypothetical protein V9E91_00695 [Burkholderiaceae bacterium]